MICSRVTYGILIPTLSALLALPLQRPILTCALAAYCCVIHVLARSDIFLVHVKAKREGHNAEEQAGSTCEPCTVEEIAGVLPAGTAQYRRPVPQEIRERICAAGQMVANPVALTETTTGVLA